MIDQNADHDGQLAGGQRGQFTRAHFKPGIADKGQNRRFGPPDPGPRRKRHSAGHRAKPRGLQHQARGRAVPHLADEDPVRATVGGDDSLGGHDGAQGGKNLMRAPDAGAGEGRLQRQPCRLGCVIRPAVLLGLGQRRQCQPDLPGQGNVGAVHPVVAPHRGNLDNGLVRSEGVAPADPHLDRVIADQQDRVGLCDQRQQDAVRPWRQTRATQAQRVGFGHQALALVGGDQGDAMRAAEVGDRRPCAFVDRIDPGYGNRAPCPAQSRLRGGQSLGWWQAKCAKRHAGDRRFGCQPFGHADGHIHMHRPRLARSGQCDGPRHARTHGPRRQPEAALDHGPQHGLMVKHLMGIGFRLGRIDAAGQKDQRHPVLHRVGNHIDRVGHPRPKGGHQNRQGTGHVPKPLGHETAAVFMLDQHECQPGAVQPLHQGEHLTARNPEGMGGPGPGQSLADDVRAGRGHMSSVPSITPAAASACKSSAARPSKRDRTGPVSPPKAGGALA